MKPILEISHLEKRFGDHLVLKDINFQVDQGEVISQAQMPCRVAGGPPSRDEAISR